MTCVTANLKENESNKLESFRYLWRRDDHLKMATIPARDVAGNIKQLIYLMVDNRIRRDEVGLSVEEWTAMIGLREWNMVGIPAFQAVAAVPASI